LRDPIRRRPAGVLWRCPVSSFRNIETTRKVHADLGSLITLSLSLALSLSLFLTPFEIYRVAIEKWQRGSRGGRPCRLDAGPTACRLLQGLLGGLPNVADFYSAAQMTLGDVVKDTQVIGCPFFQFSHMTPVNPYRNIRQGLHRTDDGYTSYTWYTYAIKILSEFNVLWEADERSFHRTVVYRTMRVVLGGGGLLELGRCLPKIHSDKTFIPC
jgi:hypothetical protein